MPYDSKAEELIVRFISHKTGIPQTRKLQVRRNHVIVKVVRNSLKDVKPAKDVSKYRKDWVDNCYPGEELIQKDPPGVLLVEG